MAAERQLSVVCPVNDERADIGTLVARLEREIHVSMELIVVYDDDAALPTLALLAPAFPVRLVKNRFGRGALDAIKTGFREAACEATLVVKADFSDDLSVVGPMHELFRKGCDVVCGSRYVKGSRQVSGPRLTGLMSRIAGVALHWLAGIPTHDVTHSFKMYRTTFLDGLEIESTADSEVPMEIVVKAFAAGRRIAELPTACSDAAAGASPLRLRMHLPSYLRWHLLALRQRLLTLAGLALVALAALVAYDFVRTFGVDVPAMDEWALVRLFALWKQGTLAFADLWQQHNEHRVLFPKVVMLLFADATAFNSKQLMYGSWLGLTVAASLLLADGVRQRGGRALLELAPVAWLLLSLRQWENLLWAWQIQIVMCVLGVIATTLALARVPSGRWMGAGMASAVLASFSFANGILIWPAGLVQLLAARRFQPARVWSVAGAATITCYLVGWERPSYHPSPAYVLQHLGVATRYLLGSIGGALFAEFDVAVVAGVVLLVLLAALGVLRLLGKIRIAPGPLALVSFSLASSVMLMFGRAAFGPEQAMASRYSTITVLAWAGAWMIGVEAMRRHGAGTFVAGALLGTIALGLGVTDGVARGVARQMRQNHEEDVAILRSFPNQPDEALLRLFPDAGWIRRWAPTLEEYHVSVFRQVAPAPSKATPSPGR